MTHHATVFPIAIIGLIFSMNLFGSEATIWQGFSHQWQRMAFKQFYAPHRISVMSSLISEDGQSIKIGQSPGVDGDYMMAKGFIEKISAEGVQFQYQIIDFEFSDWVTDNKPAPVLNEHKKTVSFDYDPSHGNLLSAIMGGFSIDSQCIETNDYKCNSNGFWPYLMSFDVGQCQIKEKKANCQLETKIGRAWTPNKGGIPYIDTKPFNFKMKFKVKMGVLLAQAPAKKLQAIRYQWSSREENGRKQGLETKSLKPLVSKYPLDSMTFGFHHMSFLFDGRRGNQPGRYIGGMAMNAHRTESRDVLFQSGIHIPYTVNNTPITWKIGVTTWSFAPDTNFQVQDTKTINAAICAESRNAPFYSKWAKCAELGYPVNQEMLDIDL